MVSNTSFRKNVLNYFTPNKYNKSGKESAYPNQYNKACDYDDNYNMTNKEYRNCSKFDPPVLIYTSQSPALNFRLGVIEFGKKDKDGIVQFEYERPIILNYSLKYNVNYSNDYEKVIQIILDYAGKNKIPEQMFDGEANVIFWTDKDKSHHPVFKGRFLNSIFSQPNKFNSEVYYKKSDFFFRIPKAGGNFRLINNDKFSVKIERNIDLGEVTKECIRDAIKLKILGYKNVGVRLKEKMIEICRKGLYKAIKHEGYKIEMFDRFNCKGLEKERLEKLIELENKAGEEIKKIGDDNIIYGKKFNQNAFDEVYRGLDDDVRQMVYSRMYNSDKAVISRKRKRNEQPLVVENLVPQSPKLEPSDGDLILDLKEN
jgi:hypothetical protein